MILAKNALALLTKNMPQKYYCFMDFMVLFRKK